MSVTRNRENMPAVPDRFKPPEGQARSLGGAFQESVDPVGSVDRQAAERKAGEMLKAQGGLNAGGGNDIAVVAAHKQLGIDQAEQERKDQLDRALQGVNEYIQKLTQMSEEFRRQAAILYEKAITLRAEAQKLFDKADIMEDALEALQNGTATSEQRTNMLQLARRKHSDMPDNITDNDLTILVRGDVNDQVTEWRVEALGKINQAEADDAEASALETDAEKADDLVRDLENADSDYVVEKRLGEATIMVEEKSRESEAISAEIANKIDEHSLDSKNQETVQGFDFNAGY